MCLISSPVDTQESLFLLNFRLIVDGDCDIVIEKEVR